MLAAILLAQCVVHGSIVDEQNFLITDRVGELQERRWRDIGKDKVRASIHFCFDLFDQIVRIGVLNHIQNELLVDELAGGIVVLYA
jgi:hypothetical protein